ncbi:helitron helicase-like domain-containing protein [Artemisia annua]|uniref:Helitron helicase-like domain-containing protein n=1 Tax=Artemisia annua TaxID=35608 RepID=A0A2U1PTQ5_ARTAN|nr:helitron helicase-like domain-containing protein [Artemisia annua]
MAGNGSNLNATGSSGAITTGASRDSTLKPVSNPKEGYEDPVFGTYFNSHTKDASNEGMGFFPTFSTNSVNVNVEYPSLPTGDGVRVSTNAGSRCRRELPKILLSSRRERRRFRRDYHRHSPEKTAEIWWIGRPVASSATEVGVNAPRQAEVEAQMETKRRRDFVWEPTRQTLLKHLIKDKHFLDNIRAYNQMFSMTLFGAEIDDSVNDGRGPYVFKISGEIHHWIGTICPTNINEPKFMQLYVYDTQNEVANRMKPFGGKDGSQLKAEIVQSLIQILDDNNELVRTFRTAREKFNEPNVTEFKIQLYNVVGTHEYQLPSSGTLGAIVFESGANSQTDYDVIIEYKDRDPQRINKLHSSYMSLQYPLLFVYGQPGYKTKMTLTGVHANRKRNKLSMNMYYKYQLHERVLGLFTRVKSEVMMTDSKIVPIQQPDKKKLMQVEVTIKELHYIGCYISSGKAGTIGDPNKDQMVIRKVEIQNLNRISIELTLWDDLAEKFEKDKIDALEKLVIIAVSSCKVSRYKKLFNLNPPLEIVRQPYEDKEQEKLRNRFPLSVLLQQTPKMYEGVRFTCEGTLTSINASRDWYYPSCTTCSLKAEYNDGIFDCKVHGSLEYPSYRYNFKANLTDNTATTTITFFTPKANDIVGIDCNSLVASLANTDPRTIPEKIQQIVGKRHIFQFQYKTSSKQLQPEFIFSELLDKPDTPKEIADKPSGSGTIQDIPQQTQPTAVIGYLPAPAESTEIQATQVTAKQEQHPQGEVQPIQSEQRNPAEQQNNPAFVDKIAQQTVYPHTATKSNQGKQPVTEFPGDTPPTLENTLAKQSSKESPTDTKKSTSAKRALFQEKANDGKKKKE